MSVGLKREFCSSESWCPDQVGSNDYDLKKQCTRTFGRAHVNTLQNMM